MSEICVVGGGPAGMMAAYAAGSRGHIVTLLEKNAKLGKKLYLTGKGRCNITNAAPIEDFFDSVVTGGAFLYSAFYTLDNVALLELLARFGLKTKTERGGRVFPESDKASDVTRALTKAISSVGVIVRLNTRVEGLLLENGRCAGVIVDGKPERYHAVIMATGGLSYPATGSTGDGYEFARSAGHDISAKSASLVGLDTVEDASGLAGLTLKNVSLTLTQGKRKLFSQQGEMLFTHTGVSGPLVLSTSAYVQDGEDYVLTIDLKPALDEKTLDRRVLRDISEAPNKNFSNLLGGLLPSRLIAYFCGVCGIAPDTKAHSITREQRAALVRKLKALRFQVKRKRPIEEAVITRGGVSRKQIDPSTMQSRICPGLYFAGEMIDVDALTGGYNLQIAFSTGYLAGISAG
jgi:predicted Rossmann fold flavoprotein